MVKISNVDLSSIMNPMSPVDFRRFLKYLDHSLGRWRTYGEFINDPEDGVYMYRHMPRGGKWPLEATWVIFTLAEFPVIQVNTTRWIYCSVIGSAVLALAELATIPEHPFVINANITAPYGSSATCRAILRNHLPKEFVAELCSPHHAAYEWQTAIDLCRNYIKKYQT